MNKIKVLICYDSALIRSVMTEIIKSQPDMEVVGVAPDPLVARDLIKQTNPDVLTLDVEMPKMDGLDFLERLMRLRPMPVVPVKWAYVARDMQRTAQEEAIPFNPSPAFPQRQDAHRLQ